MWFSKDGKKLAFASFNDSLTRVMSIPFYGIPGNLDFQYSRAVNIRYPKVIYTYNYGFFLFCFFFLKSIFCLSVFSLDLLIPPLVYMSLI